MAGPCPLAVPLPTFFRTGVDAPESSFGRLASGEDDGVGKLSPDALRFLCSAGKGSEVETGEVLSRNHTAPDGLRDQFRRGGIRIAEEGVGNHQWGAAVAALHLQAEQVAPGREVLDRDALHQITALLVHERFEGNQIERAIGRYEQTGGVAEKGAERL